MAVTELILTLNAGSSSIKFCLYGVRAGDFVRTGEGQIEGIGAAPHFTGQAANGVNTDRRWDAAAGLTHVDLLGVLIEWVEHTLDGAALRAVGHRVVHGGAEFSAPIRIDESVLARLEALTPLAPLHQPLNLAPVRALMKSFPDLPQVACFDTAFHRGHAPEVDRFGLPRQWEALGVKRYGFHGLSYEFIAERMRVLDPMLASGRMIVAHLGNGASLCAIHDGRSVDTTMGFTALDGLLMGTRCGAMDPGVLLFLAKSHAMSPDSIEDLLYKRSGLLGVSQISSDMRTLLKSDNPTAREAIALFVFRIVRDIGALAASMGGIDGLVFTAGIGEHASEVRASVCARLAWMGLRVDPRANEEGGANIAAPGSKPIWVVPTDEEQMIAHHTRAVIGAGLT